MLDQVYAPKKDIVAREMEDETVLVPLASHVADMDTLMKLNETGAFIWKHLDGKRSLRDIVSLILETYEVTRPEAEEAVEEFMKEIADFVELKNP